MEWEQLVRPWFGNERYVRALAVSGTNLYAGGGFTTAGGIAANLIAKWNGSSWSALGSGISAPAGSPYYGGNVYALAASGTDVYVGGYFTTAGGNAATNIAKWNGSSWSALGSPGGSVFALTVGGCRCELLAGGDFGTAAWNGSSWSAFGSGASGIYGVYALAVFVNDLYAGGRFTMRSGNDGNYIDALGRFTTAGGVSANYIAKWNGSSWSALGSGMGGFQFGFPYLNALAVSGSDLYAGGGFTTAGGKVSAYVAKAYLLAAPGGIADSILESDGTATLKFYGNPGHSFDVQRTTNLAPPITWTTITTSPLSPASDGSFTFIDTNAPAGTAYYRAVER